MCVFHECSAAVSGFTGTWVIACQTHAGVAEGSHFLGLISNLGGAQLDRG